MANTLTATAEAMALDFLFDTTAVTRPTAWYLALHVGANGGAGASNEITTGVGYSRQSVTFTRSSNVISNSNAITFGPDTTTNWGTVTDMTVWTAATGGTCLAQGTVTTGVAYSIGDSATVAVGAVTVTLV